MTQPPDPISHDHDSASQAVVLTTDRLRLEPWGQSDLRFFFELLNVPWVRKHLWDNSPVTEEQILSAWEESQRTFFTHRFGLWKVMLTAGRLDIGFAGLRFVGATDSIEVLYGLFPTYWKRGLATEAVRAVLDHGFRDLALERIGAATHSDNIASRQLILRLGMKPTGIEQTPTGELELFEIDQIAYWKASPKT